MEKVQKKIETILADTEYSFAGCGITIRKALFELAKQIDKTNHDLTNHLNT